MSKFDYSIFYGGYDELAVNKQKYTKEQAIEIAKIELERNKKPYYIAVGEGYVRHRAGVDEDGKPCVCWWLEYSEHKRSCPCWVFHVTADKNEFCAKEYEYILIHNMSREILFRGKHVHTLLENRHLEGAWIYGYLSSEKHINSPELEGEFLIDPETVCQYTGLDDKNGRKIFEGDICKTHYANAKRNEFVETIVFNGSRFCAFRDKDGCKSWAGLYDGVPHLSVDKSVYMDEIEVIGNVFDNPELIGSTE